MKKATVLLGLGLLGAVSVSFANVNDCAPHCENIIDELVPVEEEEIIEVGYDTAQYVPEGFNAYKGMELDIDKIVCVEEEEVIEVGHDTTKHLPIGFNPYEGMAFDADDIIYVELEEEIIHNAPEHNSAL